MADNTWYMYDGMPVPISALQSVQYSFSEPYPNVLWIMDGNAPIVELFMPPQTNIFSKPYPIGLWRIDESNAGIPYTELMMDVLYVLPDPPPPPPPGPTGIPTVQPTATTEITDQASLEYRRYMNGYTNPNLYRFRDGELPENTECDVFIKGTHSHRYTSINDYEDFSTECEIP